MFQRDVVGCFIYDVPAMSLGRTERRRYDVATTFYCRVGALLVSYGSSMKNVMKPFPISLY